MPERPEQAIVVFDDLLNRFGKSSDPSLSQLLDIALQNKSMALRDLGHREFLLNHFNQGYDWHRKAIQCREERKDEAKIDIEGFLLKYYGLAQEQEKNPSNGYDLPKRVITEAELRKYIKEQAGLLTERLSQPREQPFPSLNERTVKAIVAHGKKHPWDDRVKHGWPYHSDAFKYLHITYKKWIPGLTREHLALADKSLSAHLRKKISVEGMPEWLDVPTGAEARLRAITDPVERSKLEIIREFLRDQKRKAKSKATPG
jgi:hypothetical protein